MATVSALQSLRSFRRRLPWALNMTYTSRFKRRAVQWVALNIVGMVVYLWLASSLWVRASEFGEPGGPGDAFYIAFVLWPILGLFLVLDVVALAVIIRRLQAHSVCTWIAVAALWSSVLLFDRLMAFNIVDLRYV